MADTHALLFHAAGTGRLGSRASRHFEGCETGQALIYIPMAVVWETTLLARAGRVNLRRPVRAFFADLCSNPAYQLYDLRAAQVFDADELRINRDPFDALICAAARSLNLPLLTRDGEIRGSGVVKVIW